MGPSGAEPNHHPGLADETKEGYSILPDQREQLSSHFHHLHHPCGDADVVTGLDLKELLDVSIVFSMAIVQLKVVAKPKLEALVDLS
jgi:hypothetical protein